MVFNEKPKTKYPKSVAFIISNEFCERFCFYGMRTVLVLYLTRRLGYDDDNATVLYHVFTSLVYFFPIIGAIIADSWLGRFRTIFYLSIVYTIGSIIIALGAIPPLNFPASTFTVIGLLLIAVGTGGIKPCVSAFGGDQFKIPEQAKQLATFFSLFYMSINAGSLLSTTLTPILREDVHCFGEDTCFSVAFGVPGALMVVSIFIFIFGKPFYHITKPSGNMLVMVSKCIGNAVITRSKDTTPRSHWLDYAEPKYGQKLVDDVKSLMKILLLYIPLPLFWALQDQQGSRWTFQATRMNGEIGSFTIKPDQMQVINPFLILVFIPLWEVLIYPLFEKVGVRRPLQKLTIGMMLAGCAFLISALVELKLESMDPILPGPNNGQLRVFNGYNCSITVQSTIATNRSDVVNQFQLGPMEMYEQKNIPIINKNNFLQFDYKIVPADNCNINKMTKNLNGVFKIRSSEASTYFLTTTTTSSGANSELQKKTPGSIIEFKDFVGKPEKGFPLIRILANTEVDRQLTFKRTSSGSYVEKSFQTNKTDQLPIPAGQYDIYVDGILSNNIRIHQGAVYTILINEITPSTYTFKYHVITQPNEMHILWQLPQYIIITAGEIMFSVTGLEFSFTQAPISMKSVLQACWLLAVAFGNVIVVIVAKIKFFESQSSEFFLFFGLMIIDVCLFIFLAMRYKYRDENDDYPDLKTNETSTEIPRVSLNGRGGISSVDGPTNRNYGVQPSYRSNSMAMDGPVVKSTNSGMENKGYTPDM